MINMVKLPTNKSSLFLRVAKGHFATSHSHINYYIDVTTQKARLSEAKAVAKELVAAYQHSTIVDTVLCLDGTQVIGTCLANELTKDGFANMNAHQTIYVITPECMGYEVTSIFDPSSLPDYASFDSRDCPMCKAGQHIDALVNSFGYSAL